MEILKRAKQFQSGEGVSAFESETNVREEVNRRTHKAGYTDRDGQPRTRLAEIVSMSSTEIFRSNYDKIKW